MRLVTPSQPQMAFLAANRTAKTIVYFLTCACVEHASLVLRRHPSLRGLHTSALHGKLKQAQREATLSAFAQQPSGLSHHDHCHHC